MSLRNLRLGAPRPWRPLVRLGAPEAPGICPALSNGCYATGVHLSYFTRCLHSSFIHTHLATQTTSKPLFSSSCAQRLFELTTFSVRGLDSRVRWPECRSAGPTVRTCCGQYYRVPEVVQLHSACLQCLLSVMCRRSVHVALWYQLVDLKHKQTDLMTEYVIPC